MTSRKAPQIPPSPPIRTGAPVVVMAGGAGVPARKWAPVVAELSDARAPDGGPYPYVIVDRPGLGRRRAWTFGDVPDFGDEVGRVVHDLRRCREEGGSPVILAVHSAAGFLAEGAVRANPGLVDGVLLIDVSVVEDAGRPSPVFEAVSHATGLTLEPLVRWAWPRMRRGELSSMLLENAVFSRWARDLRDLRAVDAAVGDAGGSGRVRAVTAVTDIFAVPKRRLRVGEDPAAVAAAAPGREAHLRVWGELAGGSRDGEDGPEVAILAPCPHMVMTHRPADVVAQISGLVARTSPRAPA